MNFWLPIPLGVWPTPHWSSNGVPSTDGCICSSSPVPAQARHTRVRGRLQLPAREICGARRGLGPEPGTSSQAGPRTETGAEPGRPRHTASAASTGSSVRRARSGRRSGVPTSPHETPPPADGQPAGATSGRRRDHRSRGSGWTERRARLRASCRRWSWRLTPVPGETLVQVPSPCRDQVLASSMRARSNTRTRRSWRSGDSMGTMASIRRSRFRSIRSAEPSVIWTGRPRSRRTGRPENARGTAPRSTAPGCSRRDRGHRGGGSTGRE